MRKILHIGLWSLVTVVALVAALLGYFVYVPAPERPHLLGTISKGVIEAGGLKRSYLTYVPLGLAKGAPLLFVLHGSGESGAEMRGATGYGFERLADRRGFAVVYPDGYEGYWNGCNVVGDYSANRLNIDDVGFLSKLAGKLAGQLGSDSRRIFAMGISRGGHMAFRLALEAPSRFRAVAAVSASVPAPENFKCKPGASTSSVMTMNGTDDPLNPFDGGEVRLFGLFLARGTVLSSQDSARYFARLNHIAGPPATRETAVADGVRVEDVLWRNRSNVEVELVAIHGGGHGIPQPYRRGPRLLGPTPREPNGPAVIWDFFARQSAR
jgi:polyhydroxybutyrate depolymerase